MDLQTNTDEIVRKRGRDNSDSDPDFLLPSQFEKKGRSEPVYNSTKFTEVEETSRDWSLIVK